MTLVELLKDTYGFSMTKDLALIVMFSSFAIGVRTALLSAFLFATAAKLGAITSQYVDNELLKLTNKSQNLSGFDNLPQQDDLELNKNNSRTESIDIKQNNLGDPANPQPIFTQRQEERLDHLIPRARDNKMPVVTVSDQSIIDRDPRYTDQSNKPAC